MKERQCYNHLTYNDRIKVEALYNQNLSKAAIANEIGCHVSTIYRELKRGLYTRLTTQWEQVESYSADIAQKDYNCKAAGKGAHLKLGKNFKLSTFIEQKIGEGDSPAAAISRAKNSPKNITVNICVKTLYNYIHG